MKTLVNSHNSKLIHSFIRRLVMQIIRCRFQLSAHNFQICSSTNFQINLSSLIATVFIAFSLNSNAQQVIASSGGYFEGENISFSWTLGETVIETFEGGDIILTQGFQQPYNFYLSQILNILAGWSGISGYVDPVNKGVEGIFDGYIPDFVILASMTGFYYPAGGINTIGDWDYETGYKIKAENEFEVTLTGTKIDPPYVDLTGGWNLIPVLTSCGSGTGEVFDGMTSLQIVKEVAGPNVFWPAYEIETLEDLVPGKAYFVLMTENDGFTWPECSKSTPIGKPQEKPQNYTPWNNLNYTAASHTIAFPLQVLLSSGIQPGDYIGTFTPDGLCAGRTEIIDLSSNVAVVAFANDETTTEKDGFVFGEMLQFKVFRPFDNEEMILDVEFDPSMPNIGIYENHGLSVCKGATLNPASTTEDFKIISAVYPNPSHGLFTLSMSAWPGDLHIILLDTKGEVINSFEPGYKPANSGYRFDVRDLPKGLYILKLIYQNTIDVKKIMIH